MQGASRCLRSLLGADAEHEGEEHPHFLAYAHVALAGFLSTVNTAFHERRWWRAVPACSSVLGACPPPVLRWPPVVLPWHAHPSHLPLAPCSYWTAAALLDLSALWSVWRRHKAAHAEVVAAGSVRRAAQDPANPSAHMQPPALEDMPLLLLAGAHSKAAYGAAAATICSSAASYAYLVTLGNMT